MEVSVVCFGRGGGRPKTKLKKEKKIPVMHCCASDAVKLEFAAKMDEAVENARSGKKPHDHRLEGKGPQCNTKRATRPRKLQPNETSGKERMMMMVIIIR